MTRVEVHIDRLVLRGVPDDFAAGIAPLVEERLAELATADRRGEDLPSWVGIRTPHEPPASDGATLAARVARDVWAAAAPRVGTEGRR